MGDGRHVFWVSVNGATSTPWRYVKVKGRCPACKQDGVLFVGANGWLTCSWIPCPDPLAASRLLERSDG